MLPFSKKLSFLPIGVLLEENLSKVIYEPWGVDESPIPWFYVLPKLFYQI